MNKKYIRKRNAFMIMAGLVIVAFISLYFFIPKIYTSSKSKSIDQSIVQLKSEILNNTDIQMCITRYAIEHSATVRIQSSDLEYNYQTPTLQNEPDITKSEKMDYYGKEITITTQFASNEVKVLKQCLAIALPIGCISILLILAFDFYLKLNSSSDDFKDLIDYTNEMLKSKRNIVIPSNTPNKSRNLLARNINGLYTQSMLAREGLKNKIEESLIIEEQIDDALNEMSNRIDRPIDEIQSLISKMIRNEGQYSNHQIYLIDLFTKVGDLGMALKNGIKNGPKNTAKPQSVEVLSLFEKTLSPYEILTLEKRVNMVYHFENNFNTSIKQLLFSKAMNHLMNFVINQCYEKTTILITSHHYDVIIAYKGAALPKSSANRVMQDDSDLRNLFDLVKAMGLFLDFTMTDEKDGMKFVFHF